MRRGPVALTIAAICMSTQAAEGSFTRSMEVEKERADLYRITCTVRYQVDSSHAFHAALFVDATGISPTYPYGFEISPENPVVQVAQNGSVFDAVLGKGRLDVRRTFWVDPSREVPGANRMCQGGGVNRTTGHELPRVLMYDFQ